ncbi:gluconate 2-dehydrogenase subunit 3 family protein [Peristeroidobacter agariperforans]|uniref:gluconate 2-dehydrogenase subunit 3 family protein n=1 Tax=Peristeroidobacter agariperforans TaxID=268404 RepID=UPI0018E52660|nr:gluconate 2-dehydrogenase subunit 3 family protein [Peristeroidobacter agariperforans]
MSADNMNMNRRQVLQRAAYLMGGALSAPAVLGLLSGCAPKQEEALWEPVFFSKEQGAIVADVAEIIIPRTKTPGAKDVGVPGFIDTMLKDVYEQADRDRYLAGLKEFDDAARKAHGKPFVELSKAQQTEQVRKFNDDAIATELSYDPRPKDLKRPFILMTRELTLLGFFCSEVGATQVLQYVAVPGGFQACVPVAEAGNGRAWAQEAMGRL